MEEERIDSARLESMTDAEVSGLFADGRGKRGEECLEPDYARVCDQLARAPKMTLALRWARYCDCNPGGKRLYGYSAFCRKVGEYAKTRDLVARIAHEPGTTMLVDWAGLTASVFDPVAGRRPPAYLFVASFPWSGLIHAECFADSAAAPGSRRTSTRPRQRAACPTSSCPTTAPPRPTAGVDVSLITGRIPL